MEKLIFMLEILLYSVENQMVAVRCFFFYLLVWLLKIIYYRGWHTEFDTDKLTTHNIYFHNLYISSYKHRDNMNFNVISDKLDIMQNLYCSKKLLIKLK